VRFQISIIFALMLSLPAVVRAADSDAIALHSNRELFVDHFLIDQIHGAELRLHRPHDEGSVLKFDAPWEGPFCAYVTVIHAPDKYQMYYRGASGDESQVTCYAESADGVTWTKPALSLFPTPGHATTNIVLADTEKVTHNFSPFFDSSPNAKADERYKAIGGYDDTGLMAYASADGIHWRKLQDEPILTRKQIMPTQLAFDSQNVAFWSEAEHTYLLYFRVYRDKFRRIARVQSDDFLHWTDPVLMEYRRSDDSAPIEQLYTNQTQPYFRAPQIYVSTAARFMLGRRVLTTQQANEIQVNPKYFNDTSDAIFMTSRGGSIYDRTFLTAFIAPGIGAQNWVSRTNYPALGVVQTSPTEMSVYINQNYGQPTACLHRYSLRLDGFASVEADYDGGDMITRPLTFDGDSLFLNFATSAAGGIRLEIQDATGHPIPGFSLADCHELIGNEIERPVSFNGGSLAKLAGQAVRVHFVMKDADLFSMRFGNSS
jgi:hypothetical protein